MSRKGFERMHYPSRMLVFLNFEVRMINYFRLCGYDLEILSSFFNVERRTSNIEPALRIN